MASSMPGEQIPSVQTGQKRKREDDDIKIKNESKTELKNEIKDEDAEVDDGANVDTHTLVPNNYEPDENDENELDSDNGDDDNAVDDDANHPVHHESDEPLPPCAYYDEVTEEAVQQLTSIAERIHVLLEDHNSGSKLLAAHKENAKELSEVPSTKKIKIAILGGAGAGKSSLLNAVTGKPDLAKSVNICSKSYLREYANLSKDWVRAKLHMRTDRIP
jgi:hypothetical protein